MDLNFCTQICQNLYGVQIKQLSVPSNIQYDIQVGYWRKIQFPSEATSIPQVLMIKIVGIDYRRQRMMDVGVI